MISTFLVKRALDMEMSQPVVASPEENPECMSAICGRMGGKTP